MSDGNLRKIFQECLPEFHWCGIETGSTGRGIPDANYCFNGTEGWIEFKITKANAVSIAPEQSAWIERRRRVGGRVFIAVRKIRLESPRLSRCDELHLFHGDCARALMTGGLKGPPGGWAYEKGPQNWDWPNISLILRGLAP